MTPVDRPRAVFAVAHPDDETIFFGGTIADLARRGWAVTVACATSDFGDARRSSVRAAELAEACRRLGARPIQLGFADRPGPLDAGALAAALAGAFPAAPDAIYTHGPLGEYGHPHHTSVCRAAHRAFAAVRALAGPFDPVEVLTLDPVQLAAKRDAAAAYPSQPFAVAWCSAVERFACLDPDDVELLADLTLGPRPLPREARPRALVHRCLAAFAPDAAPGAELARIPPELWRPVHAARAALLGALLAA
ncbi:MAG TPA: PIG-L family deacetylase [Kofleriaceae bacterium]